jgi:hypothetical protein
VTGLEHQFSSENCCKVVCTRVVECVRAYGTVCVLICVMRPVASTYGRFMTNGANYTRGKLHHSPWHSDIRTPNQLNTPPGRLSYLFQKKTVNKGEVEPIKHCGSPRNKCAQSIYFQTAFPMPFLFLNRKPFQQPLRKAPRPIPRPCIIPIPGAFLTIPWSFPRPIPIIPIAAHFLNNEGFVSGFGTQWASISVVGT